uniref:Palmitoyltransferase n=1 Tax=Spermophilus dauricus TaxID=99837 RepID=A0A8C9Q6N4_SPEDA
GHQPPGRGPRGAPEARCLWCCSAKPPRAHHCCVCGRCVRKMDHHCTWVNNCVGEDNQKYFVLFTLYMGLASLHLLLLLGIPVMRSHAQGEWDRHSTVSPRRSLMYLFLVALIAFLLNSTMFAMQMYSICTDRTLIERLQRDRGLPRKGSPWSSLKAVFGHRVSLAWLSPFASPEPQRVEEHHWMV